MTGVYDTQSGNIDTQDMLYLCRREVERACAEIDSVAAISEALQLHGLGQTILPDEAYLGWQNEQDEHVRNLNMPGYLGGSLHVAGTKIINGNIGNPGRGLPRASGLTLLYDSMSGRITCLMEGAYISSLRTASVSVLSAQLLGVPRIETVAVIGAGVLAHAHIELLARSLKHVRQIRIFDLDQERIALLQKKLAPVLEKHDISWLSVATAEEAIRPAQLIIPVTTTTTGYISYAWLQPGAVLVNVSLDDPLPEVVFKADAVIVDDWNLVKNDPRRLLGRMYRAGQIRGPDEPASSDAACRCVDAQLGDIISGKKDGRRTDNDIILVNPFGLAIEDVALATRVHQIARQHGWGMRLER
ncbi:MAG: ornithine cyclodeaminase [Ktedonobacteraceae bacterium]|nr:ornithine cyclodeaminase [Ktedonobacteraceae bacterium]